MGAGRLRDVLVGLGTAAAVVGCAAHDCTLIGCSSAVEADLTPAVQLLGPGEVTAELCVDARCSTTTLDADALAAGSRVRYDWPTSGDGPGARPVRVTLRVTRAGTPLVDTGTVVTLERFAPNGEDCAPVCFSAALDLSPTGTLVPDVAPSAVPGPT